MTTMTAAQTEILRLAGCALAKARRHPGIVHGSILLGAGDLRAARALERKGLVDVVRGVNGGTVTSWYARPIGHDDAPWSS